MLIQIRTNTYIGLNLSYFVDIFRSQLPHCIFRYLIKHYQALDNEKKSFIFQFIENERIILKVPQVFV